MTFAINSSLCASEERVLWYLFRAHIVMMTSRRYPSSSPSSSSSSQPSSWLLLARLALFAVVVVVDASPSCYEYWEEGCSGTVRQTYHALTGGTANTQANCSAVNDFGGPVWGTTCLTTGHVALTQFEPFGDDSCRKTFGSVQAVSECVPLGRGFADGRARWMYCTKTGCDTFGEFCANDPNLLVTPGTVKLWNDLNCGASDFSDDGIEVAADGKCRALDGDVGASFRLSCINSVYMQVQMYDDLNCEVEAALATAPTFLEQDDDGDVGVCYQFQGTTGSFGMTVESPCDCSGRPDEPDEPDNILRYDIMYNITLNGTHCLEGTRLDDLAYELEGRTQRDVSIDMTGALLVTDQGTSWWTIDLALRFLGIPADTVLGFQQDLDASVDDGSMLGLVTDVCGAGNVNVTLLNRGSSVWDHETTTRPPSSGTAASLLSFWPSFIKSMLLAAGMMAMAAFFVS